MQSGCERAARVYPRLAAGKASEDLSSLAAPVLKALKDWHWSEWITWPCKPNSSMEIQGPAFGARRGTIELSGGQGGFWKCSSLAVPVLKAAKQAAPWAMLSLAESAPQQQANYGLSKLTKKQ